MGHGKTARYTHIDGGQAWIITLAVFGANLLCVGYLRAVGVFFLQIVDTFHTSSSVTSLIMSVQQGTLCISALLVHNVLLELVEVRTSAIMGGVLFAGGVALAYFAQGISFLVFSLGILVGMGNALTYGPGLVLLGQYFSKRRALAFALATTGSSVGSMTMPLLATSLLQLYGLRGAWLLYGAITLHLCVFTSLYRPVHHNVSAVKTPRVEGKAVDDDDDDDDPPEHAEGEEGGEEQNELLDKDRMENPGTHPHRLRQEDKALFKDLTTADLDQVKLSDFPQETYEKGVRNGVCDGIKNSSEKALIIPGHALEHFLNDESEKRLVENGVVSVSGKSLFSNFDPKGKGRDMILPTTLPVIRVDSERTYTVLESTVSASEPTDRKLVDVDVWPEGQKPSPSLPPCNKHLLNVLWLHKGHRHVSTSPPPEEEPASVPPAAPRLFLSSGDVSTRFPPPGDADLVKTRRSNTLSDLRVTPVLSHRKAAGGTTKVFPTFSGDSLTYSLKSIALYASQPHLPLGAPALVLRVAHDDRGVSSNSPSSYKESPTAACFKGHGDACHQSPGPGRWKSLSSKVMCEAALLRDPLFWLLLAYSAMGMIGAAGAGAYLPSLCQERGLNRSETAMVLTTWGGVNLVGRLLVGLVADRRWLRPARISALAFLGIGTLFQLLRFFPRDSLRAMLSVGVLYGLFEAAYFTMLPVIIIDFLSLKHFSRTFGFAQLSQGACATIMYPLLGKLRDVTGSYNATFHCLGACALTACVLLLMEPGVRALKRRRDRGQDSRLAESGDTSSMMG